MGSLASDHCAAIELIIDGYRRLQVHNSEHELLQYITNVTDQSFEYVKGKYEEFLDRFETPEDKKLDYVKVAKVLATYFVVLRNASDEIEGIDRTPKQPVNTTPVKTLDEIKYDSSDDDIPF